MTGFFFRDSSYDDGCLLLSTELESKFPSAAVVYGNKEGDVDGATLCEDGDEEDDDLT